MNARRVFAFAVIGAAGIGLFAASDPARAQVTSQGGGYLFRLKFTKGQTIRYEMATSMQAPGGKGGPMNFSVPVTMKITDVKNGIATVTSTTTMPAMGGKSKAQPMSETVKIDNRGRPQGDKASSMQGMQMALPAGPIKVGGTWTDTIKGGAVPGMAMKGSYKLLSVQGGVATISMSVSGDGQGMKISGTGTMKVAVADGWTQSAKLNMRMNMGSGKDAQAMSVNLTMTRK